MAATRLFDKGTNEQVIMLKTGHKSTAVCAYQRVSEEKLSHLSDSLACKAASQQLNAVGVALSTVVTNLKESWLWWLFFKSFSEGNGGYSAV